MEKIHINPLAPQDISLGMQFDNNYAVVVFDVEPGNYYLKLLDVDGNTYEAIPLLIEDGLYTFPVTSNYTQKATTYLCQLMKTDRDGYMIHHGKQFNMYVESSIGYPNNKEVVPPNFQTAYDQIMAQSEDLENKVNTNYFVPTLIIDNVETLEPAEDAYVRLNGTRIINVEIGIPQGIPGEETEEYIQHYQEVLENAEKTKEWRDETEALKNQASDSASNASRSETSASVAASSANASKNVALTAANDSASSASQSNSYMASAWSARNSAQGFSSSASSYANAASASAFSASNSLSRVESIERSFGETVETKTEEFDAHVVTKIAEFDEHAASKTEKHLLSYDGTHISENGVNLTFAQIYTMLMETPDFVVLVYDNYAYHPNGVSTEQIVFSSSYPVSSIDTNHRITMLKSGVVTKTDVKDENVVNKTNAITELNKDSEVKYPSLKAVSDYVEPIKEDLNNCLYIDEEGYICLKENING